MSGREIDLDVDFARCHGRAETAPLAMLQPHDPRRAQAMERSLHVLRRAMRHVRQLGHGLGLPRDNQAQKLPVFGGQQFGPGFEGGEMHGRFGRRVVVARFDPDFGFAGIDSAFPPSDMPTATTGPS